VKDGWVQPSTEIALIERIVTECPRRVAGSPSERRAQEILASEFVALGLDTGWHDFEFTRSIYASLALHFGLALAASGLLLADFAWPAFALHAVVALSYGLESTKRLLILRRLLPRIRSQNLVATAAASAPLRRRVVVIAHADAAPTGLVFHPAVIRAATKEPPWPWLRFLRKSLGLATASVVGLAALDVLAGLAGSVGPAISSAAMALSLPAAITLALNLDVVLRDQIVPGANDNLTGCAGAVALARRLLAHRPGDVELVFVATGAEEAGTGGSWALARDRLASGAWTPAETVVLGIDGLSNGDLYYFEEGELLPIRMSPALEEVIQNVAAAHPGRTPVGRFQIPSGATDALAFVVRGYPAVTLGCVDPEIGAPRHYHLPSDTPANLDHDQLSRSIDFAEAVVRRLLAGHSPAVPATPAEHAGAALGSDRA
jgi:hypothetical protein